MKYSIFVLFSFFLLSSGAFAQEPSPGLCSDQAFESIPTQAGGRVKPLIVHAAESMRFMTGDEHLQGKSATEVFCQLALSRFLPSLNVEIPLMVEHMKTKKLLGMKEDQGSLSLKSLREKRGELQLEYEKTKKDESPYHKDLSRTLSRYQLAEAIVDGRAWTLFNKKTKSWLPLEDYLDKKNFEEFKNAQEGRGPQEILKSFLLKSKKDYIQEHGDDFLLEVAYYKGNLFTWAMLPILLGIVALTLFSKTLWTLIMANFAIVLQVIGIVMRIMISGRAPITNMYETVLFSGFGALSIGILIFLFKKEKLYLYGGLAYNFLCLFMMYFAHNMLEPSISPLVPVLRDNFWLSTHVTSITLSYAALALSWIIANTVLIQNFFSRLTQKEYQKKMEIVYNCIKVGTVLLSAGIILGGVWADYSWGRFWGWDPKETWSLIVLLVYMAILHGRYSNWIPKERFIPLTALAFLSVMMAWFGVNYILASGLHSYGFSEGGALFLMVFFLVQLALLLLTFRKPLPKKSSKKSS